MGLDQFIRKISKRKAHLWGIPDPPEEVGASFHRVPKHHSLTNEVAYWRGHRHLNRWMMALAHDRVDPQRRANLDYEIMNGAPILLRTEDILALQMEVTFGTLFSDHYRDLGHYGDGQIAIDENIDTLSRCLRISKCNRSYLYYVASW